MSTQEPINNVDFYAPNVRLFYPSVFSTSTFKKPDGTVEERSAGLTFLLNKKDEADMATLAKIKRIVTVIARSNNANLEVDDEGQPKLDDDGNKIGRMLPPDQLCVRDGDLTDTPAKHGHWIVTANCPKQSLPFVINAYDPEKIVTDPAEKPVIYNGCRANVKMQFWFQKKAAGRSQRVNGKLIAVQFAGDDEPLSAGVVTKSQAIEGFSAALKAPEFTGMGDEADEPEKAGEDGW